MAVFVVFLIIDLLLALGIASFFSSRTGTVWAGTVIGLIILAVGAIVSWISVIVLYSFGCLVEDVEYIRTRFDMTEEYMDDGSVEENYEQ